jgi:pyruvate formate-lyase activating enzyme-like uncharacterized protein
MKTYLSYLNDIANDVEAKHSGYDLPLNWFHPYKSFELASKKEELIETLGERLQFKFKHTKPYVNSISPGCQLCGDGEWSCLFITGKCNANCFYCPASQDMDGTPQTQKLLFDDPEKYVDYINRFNFKGVSFSGGEPLLVFDRILEFVKQVRQNCAPSLYIWMYTNGILATEEKFKALGEAGLNEIRFDLGAVHYNPKVLRGAAKHIKNVTVEIPAVPHEKEQLLAVLPELCALGVTNLNLHQLRLTTYNANKLLQQDYTYLHGEQPTVLESELTAFEVMQFVVENNLPIGVNYCNFQFKHRFQKAGFRGKMAQELKLEKEELTENGFLRKIEILDGPTSKPITFEELLLLKDGINTIRVSYFGRVIENIEKNSQHRIYNLDGNEFNIVEGLSTYPIQFKGAEINSFVEMVWQKGETIPDEQALFESWKFEFIEKGLRDYF